ncbi:MAG: NAD(P)-binding domain-containing protein [Deltaproteobacteria bacterium]|nr:NAD(P)-binding domain-containing protein [Deltaproteobacteria bacterium]
MEPLFMYGPLLAGVLLFYAVRRHRTGLSAVEAITDSREAGLMMPASLHPLIDPAKCLGCGACVDACPEKHVLGLIHGKAVMVTPSACIGHGACKLACPLDAITLVFGTEERGVDLPYVSPDFETNVPGLYVAGELGGMGLIRNGIEQGKQAVDAIERGVERGFDDVLDLVIVGAGPAGISATLRARELGLRSETLEQESLGGTVAHYPRGKIVMTAPVDLPIYGKVKMRETTKESLLALWRDVIDRTGIQIHYGERVDRIERDREGIFRVDGATMRIHARAVLLAIGRRGTPQKLGVSGEELSKVVYRLVDAEQYGGKHVLVVGGGDSALEAAWSLADVPGVDVTISYRGASFYRAKGANREKVRKAEREGRLSVLLESKVVGIGEDEVELQTKSGSVSIDNDAVIVCTGGILPTDFLRAIGIQIETKRGTQ